MESLVLSAFGRSRAVTSAAAGGGFILAMPAALAAQGFTLRPETVMDLPFLRRLYISTRWEELAIVSTWSDEQKVEFLESQFALQRYHYLTYYPASAWGVLEQNGVPAGRIYIDRQAGLMNVIDIALLPEWRNRGTGTALMQAVCEEARAAGKAVSVAVEKYNPAQRLYRRLGFREVSDEGVYWFMEWSAAPDDESK
jgi:ribosomal protein S18 acetylase RimI-like enzyme